AIGASRAALVRQTLIESGMLALLGGALGLPLAIAGVRALVTLYPRALPRSSEIQADLRVLIFAVLVSLITGVIFGIVPALRGSHVSMSEALKEGGRSGSNGRGSRFRAALVVVEVALGVVLTAAAGLLYRSFHALNEVNPGYHIRNVLTMQMAALGPKYRDPNELRALFERILARVQEIPGVESVGTTNWLPLRTDRNSVAVWIDTMPVQDDETKIFLDNRVVTPNYFRAMGAPLIAGRFF